ncbi:MAG: c-type cytochrome [Chitinophagaceae bacterium]|nr:c-type cytochrome [Chitinophagaceae bacterium]
MRKIVRALVVIVFLLVIIAGAAAAYVYFFLPNVGPAANVKIEATPQRIERGKYLAEHVAVCIDCHSTRDWSQFSGPMVDGSYGKGGDSFPRQFGFPGTFYARNITPYGIGSWTDGEVLRAVSSGVSKDGSALFPLMPYQHYGVSDQEDVYSIIAYIRSLPPVKNDVPRSKADFPVNVLMHLTPAKPKFATRPMPSDSVQYGQYLATMASCIDCHSMADKGEVVKGTEYGGGREFLFPGGTVRSANITTDATGIRDWTRAAFISRFKAYVDSSYHSPKLGMTDFNSPMPWTMYAGMTEADLAAIYTYLRTVKPIGNKVEKFTPKKI